MSRKPMTDWNNSTIFITGGSSGIGLACASRFAREGANIVLVARNRERLLEAVRLASAERKLPSQRLTGAVLDVSDRLQCEKEFPELVRLHGAPDLLITAAGIAWPEYFLKIPFEQFREQVAVNLEGVWNSIQCCVPFMKERGGHVVTVSSVAGFIGTFGYSAYSATKFGLIGLSEALRNELKPEGIRVSVLCPPDTETPGFERENRNKPFETRHMSSNIRVMQPEMVAEALVRGLARRKFMIIPGSGSRFSWIMKRILPSLVFKILDDSTGEARKLMRTKLPEKPVGR